jgi:splicing factor 3A subunit 3
MDDAKTHREKLFNESVVDKFLTRISEKSDYLLDLYQDKSG